MRRLAPVLLALLVPAAALAETPASAPAAAALKVTLTVKTKLRLVRWVAGKGDPGIVGLDGKLVAVIENPGAAPVRIRDLQEHGVVFTDKTGALHIPFHTCKCARDALEPETAVATVPAGGKLEVVVEEWGCSGSMFTSPPPGLYDLEYRVLLAPDPLPAAAPKESSPVELGRACKAELAADQTWAGAFRSTPVKVRLAQPLRKRLP
jgi:hypothetical protein